MALDPEEQARIGEEEATVAEVVESLIDQINYGTARWRHESARARDLTSRLVRARRDVDKQLLASDEAVSHQLRDSKADELKTLEKLVEKPYFARIVLEEQNDNGTVREIEYKLGLAANSDCRIIDWRKAPIAKLYYEYQEGDEYSEQILGRDRTGIVKMRNKVEIESGRLKRLSCALGNFLNADGEWIKTSGDAVQRSRTSYGQLPAVTSFITAEQFQTITEDAEAAVLIQGIAGSGKTTVALHRLAWLLHEENSDLKPQEVAVIVLSKTLRRYIQSSLELLNISGVPVLTYHEWAAWTLRRVLPENFSDENKRLKRPAAATPPGALRAKRSMAVLLGLEEYAQALRMRCVQHLEKTVDWNAAPKAAQTSFGVQKTRNNPAGSFVNSMRDTFEDWRRSANTLQDQEAARNAVAALDLLHTRLLDLPKHVLSVLQAASAVIRLDDTKLLDADLLKQAHESANSSFQHGTVDEADEALLFRMYQALFGTIYLPDGSRGQFRHIVVDEIQDFGASELATVIAAVEERSQLTLVGDSGQQVRDTEAFPGWERLRKRWSLGDELTRYTSLTVSHRSTAAVMRLAEHVRGEGISTGGRPGKPPLWMHTPGENRGVKEAIAWIERVTSKFPGTLLAVICGSSDNVNYVHSLLTPTFGSAVRAGDDEEFTFDEGIVVTDVSQIKGLEFPHVLLWNPSSREFPATDRARSRLYVAITRCEEHLCLITWGPSSPLLPHINSQLVRGMDLRQEDYES